MVSFTPLVCWLLLSLVVSSLLACLGLVFVKNESFMLDSGSSFECGLDPMESCRVPIALPFFIIAVIFVIFDAEMLLSLPMIFVSVTPSYFWFWEVFLMILYLGLVVEFFMQTIDWKE